MKIKLGQGVLSIEDLLSLCEGELYGDKSAEFSFVCTDSREADPDTLFVAMRGERVDGHDYISKAKENGCRCFLCERIPQDCSDNIGAVTVSDSVSALSFIAANARKSEKRKTVAITGSVGKTTTKEMVAAALELQGLYKTVGNYNSVIGLPLSMLEMPDSTEVAVFEMGMSGFGEIESMSRAATPDIAIITNIGSSHLEMLGSRENIRKAKLEITAGLKENGVLLINGDDPMLFGYDCGVKTMSVGIDNENCDFRATAIRQDSFGTDFTAVLPNGRRERCYIMQFGKHNVQAALFGIAAAYLLSIDTAIAKNGIASFCGVGMRQNIYRAGKITLIEDCYNASPESMRAAIDVAVSLGGGRPVAFLGDMKELGENSEKLHREVGEYAAKNGIELLVSYGELAEKIADGAASCGVETCRCIGGDPSAAADLLMSRLRENDILLVKASRAMKAEKVIEILKERMGIKDDE